MLFRLKRKNNLLMCRILFQIFTETHLGVKHFGIIRLKENAVELNETNEQLKISKSKSALLLLHDFSPGGL
jgi:hypothetical protein